MKKLILASTAIILSFASMAQTDSTNKMMNHDMMNNEKTGNGMNHQTMHKSHDDGVMMLNGKMMMHHNGEMTMMNRDTTMTNGTKVMTNGTCIKKDGTKMIMKEGECMEMSGKMGDCAMMHKGEKMDMAATYSCPMHPEVKSDKAGNCPKCGMDLVKEEVK